MTTTSAHERLLRLALGIFLLSCLPGLGLGLWMAGDDLRQQGEWLDGVGTLFGLALVAVVALPVLLAVLALHRSLRHRPDAVLFAAGAAAIGLLVVGGLTVLDVEVLPFAAAPLLLGVVAVTALPGRSAA
jgi:hypothetical protein